MPGTLEGGRKAADTNLKRHGTEFYRNIGSLGGKKSRGGGFTNNPELARIAGRKGGKVSRKRKLSTNEHIDVLRKEVEKDQSFWRETRMR